MTKKQKDNEFYSPVPRVMMSAMLISMGLCVIFAILYHGNRKGWLLSCAITFGVIAYHFLIRFLSPAILTIIFHKKYDYRSWWFRQRKWEPGLYSRIRVKKWKEKVLAYDPREFSTKVHSPEEIVNNMCHAELVHELIVLLSFTSLFFAIPFGAFAVFLITAVLAALVDMIFVILQRYNRPRMIAVMERVSLFSVSRGNTARTNPQTKAPSQ